MEKTIKIGLLGAGTVGSGVLQVLRENAREVALKTGASVEIKSVLVRDVNKQRPNMEGLFVTDKIEEIRYARFEEEQQKLYDAQVTHLREMLAGNLFEKGEEKMKILAELTKLRQICCDPALRVDHYKGGSAKREAAMELIKNAADAGHKMLVFSQFTSMLEILEQELRDEDISYYKITGATPKEERIRLVHAFNEDETPVFLISLKAGGTGLNLTGADFVIHYDPWWNLAAQNQATDRAHRIGQTKQVTVFRMIVKDSIEEKILHMQDAKKDLADAILAGEGKAITQMSKEEMMELLG